MSSSAIFSPCRTYRYRLDRSWPGLFDVKQTACWICLNGSTAAEDENDPSLVRMMGFAQGWGYSGIIVVNAFGFAATDPKKLRTAKDPVGPENDEHILQAIAESARLIVGWGAELDAFPARNRALITMLYRTEIEQKGIYCLGTTRDYQPRHPLYLSRDTPLVRYDLDRAARQIGIKYWDERRRKEKVDGRR